ncbi:MAG TPA: bifunctional 5,10-methylenetetrahydrofolate dehydrogenase/5,10-methenyltetrahydrofolate cyclohydrolase [Chloroflexota bacterium]|nr:bifunctional 5,10-methylenetetrahydrofolate dehydrogenase/5,10-methenyltetrahydrofolate cyclohydrolase [Chloroflexota bacterium]
MTARLLDGRVVARALREQVAAELAAFRAAGGPQPKLAIVQVGAEPAASAYVRSIARAFAAAAMACAVCQLPPDADAAAVLATIRQLDADPTVHGILIQAPLPPPLTLPEAAEAISPAKDVDGLHPLHSGRLAQGRPSVAPCTPEGGLVLLRHYGIPIAGQRAVVVGRGLTVGRPLALLLLNLDATVTLCHTRTPDLAAITREADLLVAAAGRPGLIRAAMVKPGATVLDFGVNEVDGRLVGDVAFDEVRAVAGALTPVPGGTGPVTTAVLLRRVLEAARRQAGRG